MIQRKSDVYAQIKKNITKLALIQEATEISPFRLSGIFLKYLNRAAERDELNEILQASVYKYFCRQLADYKTRNKAAQGYTTILDRLKSKHLRNEYFGEQYEEVAFEFRTQEKVLKDFVSKAFKAIFPITTEMSPREVATRNQKFGKMSVNMWIGDILNYEFFYDAPGFMIGNVERSILRVDLYVLNLLTDEELEADVMKLAINQKLEATLSIKQQSAKQKISKL